MNIYISSLIKGLCHMEEMVYWIDRKKEQNLGVELIAFTHDKDYWQLLVRLLSQLTCPRTFHGPYIGVEGASEKGTVSYAHLIDSYKRVCSLAAQYRAGHVVFHYTQKGVLREEKQRICQIVLENIRTVLDIGKQEGAQILVENLPFPASGQPLFTNEEYIELYRQFPDMNGIIDMGHACLTALDVEELLMKYGSRIHAYHFHNNNGRKDNHDSIQNGVIDYSGFSHIFKKYTPKAGIVLEYEPHNWNMEEVLERDIDFTRKMYSV